MPGHGEQPRRNKLRKRPVKRPFPRSLEQEPVEIKRKYPGLGENPVAPKEKQPLLRHRLHRKLRDVLPIEELVYWNGLSDAGRRIQGKAEILSDLVHHRVYLA